jgi:hypothetical protein
MLVARPSPLNQLYARRQPEITTSYQDRVERESAFQKKYKNTDYFGPLSPYQGYF